MLPELLAVIRGDEEDHVVVEIELLQPGDQLPELPIVVSELVVVELTVTLETGAPFGYLHFVEWRTLTVPVVLGSLMELDK